MRVIKSEVNVFEFKELKVDAKLKAITEELKMWFEGESEESVIECIEEAERLHTPWFAFEMYFEKMFDDVQMFLEEGDYNLYLEEGTLHSQRTDEEIRAERTAHTEKTFSDRTEDLLTYLQGTGVDEEEAVAMLEFARHALTRHAHIVEKTA